MKKKLYTFRFLMLVAIFAGSLSSAFSQELYWTEGFNNPGPTADPGATSTVTDWTGVGGVWKFFGVYLTRGASCPNNDGTNWHIRNTNAQLTIATDTPYVILPMVNAGISQVSFVRGSGRTNRRMTFYVTNSTDLGAATWNYASGIPKVTGYPNPTCADTTVMINAPDAVFMKIVFERAGNNDIDTVRLFSSRPLPVKFTGINAAAVNGMTKVSWNIATELNTRSYIVEKSTDGVNFKNVAEVTATNAGTYSWIDQSANAANVYYRIKSVDKDGKMGYSGVIKLSTAFTKPGFVITPNVIPGRTMNLQLTNIVKGTVTIRVSNNMGQIVYSSSLINEGGSVSKSISLPGTLQAGTYRVQLVSGSTLMTQTAILQ